MALGKGVSPASVPLPQGGGAQESIGQDFEVDLATGTGSYSVPFNFPPGPRQVKPDLSLLYSSGYGNGPMGIGWSLGVPSISRSEVDGQPSFDDESDVFSYGGQRLIPLGGGRYRQEIEKDFYRIERAAEGWEVRGKDGALLRFGNSPDTRLTLALKKPNPTLQWLLASVEDNAGNIISYEYAHADGHAWPVKISYGPYLIRLDYEDRPDPVTSYRLGVKRESLKRLRQVRLLLLENKKEVPVKAYRMGYEQAAHNGVSRLVTVNLVIFNPATDPPAEDPQPPFHFTYSDVLTETATLKPLRSRSGTLPPPVADKGLTMIDADGIGLPGFLHISDQGGEYWPNLGQLEVGPARRLQRFPTALADRPDQLRIASLAGHGLLDLVVMSGRTGGFYSLQSDREWETFRPFKRAPAIPLLHERTILMDLDFDGRADLLYADERAFYAVINRGEGDFDNPRVIPRVRDRSIFPDVDLSDAHIRVANMTGDATALVEVRDRAVVYWPNLGYGRFGAAVVMETPPDLPSGYNIRQLFLTDIDGDGLADMVYVEQNRVLCWFNHAGRSFGPPTVINHTPSATASSVMLVDLLGRGNQGLLWSGSQTLSERGTHYFLDFVGSQKADLLVKISSPRGASARISYDTSVGEALHDRDTTDAAYLPFPVQVVRRIDVTDLTTGAVAASEFKYHRGFYDRGSHRFLGFGRVEQRDIGDENAPDRLTVTHYHTRPPKPATPEATQRHHVLARMPYRVEVFGADDGAKLPFRVQEIEGEAISIDKGVDGRPVFFAARRRMRKKVTERGARSVEQELNYDYDLFGNVILEEETQRFRDGADIERIVKHSTSTHYLADSPSYLVGLPTQIIERDGAQRIVGGSRLYYDGAPFQGLPLGQATRGVMMRREVLNFTDQLIKEVYDDEPPALESLNYFHVDDSELGSGWWSIETAQEIDARGNPLRRRDQNGNTTILEFDEHGIYPTRIVNPLDQELQFSFDYRQGQLLRQVTYDGMETRWVYDQRGQLIQVIRPQDVDGQPSLVYEHEPFSNPPHLIIRQRATAGDEKQEIRHVYFDASGEEMQTRLLLDDKRVVVNGASLAYCRGMVTSRHGSYFANSVAFNVKDAPADSPVFHMRRDALDRTLESESADGTRQSQRYEAGATHYFDAEDNNPAGPHHNTPRSEYYDAHGHCVSVIERPKPETDWCTQYQRNADGQLTGATDHLGQQIFTQTFDLTGRLMAVNHREAGKYHFIHDAAGNTIEERRGSQRLFREFDALGRVTALRFGSSKADPAEQYFYDEGEGDNLKGRLARVQGGFGTVAYSYTRCGRIKAKTRTFPERSGELFTLGYKYDRQGRTLSVTYPDTHVLNLDYDASGLPKSVGGVINDVSYDAAGYLTHVTFANGVQSHYTYGQRPGRLDELRTVGADGSSYQHFLYQYDGVGNPTVIADQTKVAGHVRDDRSFVYDSLYRLTEATGRDAGGDYQHSYKYDALGNLLTRPEVNPALTLQYQGERVVGSSAGEVFSYDDTGNLTSLDGWQHAFDPLGRLTESTRQDGARVRMRYDHTGRCTSTTVEHKDGTIERTHFCDDIFAIGEDNKTEAYVFFNNHRVAILRSSGESHIIHHDPLGNPTCFSRLSDGSFSGQLIFYPYGGVALEMSFGAQSRARFGNHADIPLAGLVNFGLRVYSPVLGRFLQPDPVIIYEPERSIRLPRSLHAYGFVIGNPTTLTDPIGASIFGDAEDWFKKNVTQAFWNKLKEGAAKVWEGTKSVAGKIWEGIKWFGGVVWEGIKYLARGVAIAGTWVMVYADYGITWANPLNWISAGLDYAGDNWFTNGLSFLIKFGRSPLTSTISIGFGLYGMATGSVKDVKMERGLLAFEYDPSASKFDATTYGATVHIKHGNTSSPSFKHEAYHSYQYVSYGDAFIPTYAVGGGWGLLSAALSGKQKEQAHWWGCGFGVSNDKTYGQPMEMGAEGIRNSDNCT
jgi:RHS repeat-associated protein